MTKKGLVSILALSLAAVYFWDQERAIDATSAFKQPQEVEVLFQGNQINFKKETNVWKVISVNESPVSDPRANSDFLEHVLTSTKKAVNSAEFKNNTTSKYDRSSIKNLNPPLISIKISSTASGQKNAALKFDFAQPSLDGNSLIVEVVGKKILSQTPRELSLLLAQKTVLDFRDRRISGLRPDDVEDLVASKPCGLPEVHRDGDRWITGSLSKPTPLADYQSNAIDQWLEKWLSKPIVVQISDHANSLDGKNFKTPNCEIKLIGRNKISETIQFFQKNGQVEVRRAQSPNTAFTISKTSFDEVRSLRL